MLATKRWRGIRRASRLAMAVAVAVTGLTVAPPGGPEPAAARTFCGWQANHPGTTGPWGFSVSPGVQAMPTSLVVRTTAGTPPALSSAVDHAIWAVNAAAGAGWRRGPELPATTGVSTADRRGRPLPGELWVVGSPWRYPALPRGTYTSSVVERVRGAPAMPLSTLVVLGTELGRPGLPRHEQLRVVVHEFGHAAGLDHHFTPWGGVCQAMSYGGSTTFAAGDAFGLQSLASRAPAIPRWGNPFGRVDLAQRVPGGVRLAGWTIDPDTTGPIAVHLYVDGRFARGATASTTRRDVGRAYPAWGPTHGFDANVGLPSAGRAARVCAYAINTGVGWTNPLLGCAVVPP